MIDLRRHCDDGESDGLCNMSGTFPTTLKEGVCGDFHETLKLVAEQTRAAKENPLVGMEGMPLLHGAVRTMPMKVLMMAVGKVYGSFSLGLTNLGNMKCRDLALGELVPSEGFFGGPLKRKPGMQVSAASFDGSCSLCIVGQYTREDMTLLSSLLEHILNEITGYAQEKRKMLVALVLGFLIGVECGFMGSAGGVLMLMVLTLVLGMETKMAVGTSSLVMTLVALTGAVSHLVMGATLEIVPAIVITVVCTLGAVVSARFANRVKESVLTKAAGIVLILVSVLSLVLG